MANAIPARPARKNFPNIKGVKRKGKREASVLKKRLNRLEDGSACELH